MAATAETAVFLLAVAVSAAASVGLDGIEFIKSPTEICSDDSVHTLVLVHSKPDHFALRNAIRETWGNVGGHAAAFVLGMSTQDEDDAAVDAEWAAHGDIIQADFADSYRNMSTKHLLGYRWAIENCPGVKYILKTDDDQTVDTFHLPVFLDKFIGDEKQDLFFLCQFVRSPRVRRDPTSKWYVPESEYAADTYPNYCAGWAYVTNVPTVKAVYEEALKLDSLFWIDDVLVTGMLRPKVVQIFDWENAFLNRHAHYKESVLSGDRVSPEMLVASDVTAEQIRTVFARFRWMEEKGLVAESMYSDPEMVEVLRPPRVELDRSKKDEL